MVNGVRAIILDIDDCIWPTDGNIPKCFYGGISKLAKIIRKSPFPIGFGTGRDRNYVEACCFVTGSVNLPLQFSGISIIESGVAIFDPTTKQIKINPLYTPEVKEAFGRIRKEHVSNILDKHPLFRYPGNMINITFERKYGVTEPVETFFNAIKEELREFEETGLVTIHHSKMAVDLSPPGIDKASGLIFYSDFTGIPVDNILCIGDSGGDIPMLNIAGFCGCPSNASDECKKAVMARKGRISTFPYVCGAVQIIEELTSQYE